MNVSLEQAKGFLEDIVSNDKIAIVTHNDIDGYASGILFYDFFKNKNCKDINVYLHNIGLSTDKIIKGIKNSDKIFISDLAPSIVIDILEASKDKQVLYTDHHVKNAEIPESILEYRTESQVPSSRAVYDLVGGKKWIAVAGIGGDCCDKQNKDLVDGFLSESGFKDIEEYKQKVIFPLSSFLVYFNNEPNKAFDIFKKLESPKDISLIGKYAYPVENEIKRIVECFEETQEKLGKINFGYIKNPKFEVKSIVINQISGRNPEEIYVLAAASDGIIRLSARNQSKKYNMIKVLEKGISGLENASAGGHVPAAGGNIMKCDLEKLKENLREYKWQKKNNILAWIQLNCIIGDAAG